MQTHIVAMIINWNGSDDTLELIASLTDQNEENISIEAVIIDNHSEDLEFSKLENGLEKFVSVIPITLIRNQSNVGIPAAYNQAIAHVDKKDALYLRLDNDVVFLKGGLKLLCNALEQHRDKGVRLVGGNIRYFDNPDENNGGSVSFDLVRGKTAIEYPQNDKICDGVLGCVMLIDNEVINAFSPNVFLSWLFIATDESELSLHCSQFGWKTYYVSKPIALHKGGRSTGKVRTLSSLCSIRNWCYLALRYIRPKVLLPLVLARIIGFSIYRTFKGDIETARSMLNGVWIYIREKV